MNLSDSARSQLALSVDLRDAVVLLVDDLPREAEELLIALTESGLKVLVADSGPAAKQKLMREPVDLVVVVSRRLVIMMTIVIVICVIAMMIIMPRFTKTFLAMEDKKVHPERVEGSDEYASHHGKVSESGARNVGERDRLNDRIFRVEPGQEGRAN